MRLTMMRRPEKFPGPDAPVYSVARKPNLRLFDRGWYRDVGGLPQTVRSSMTMDRHIDRCRRRGALNITLHASGNANARSEKILPHLPPPMKQLGVADPRYSARVHVRRTNNYLL